MYIMSTSGTYNYHPKVEHPNHVFPQMKSGEYQPPFHFGGSQVPVSLGHVHGSGISHPLHGIDTGFRTPYKFTKDLQNKMTPSFSVNGSVNGRGIRTTFEKHKNIMLPTHLPSMQR